MMGASISQRIWRLRFVSPFFPSRSLKDLAMETVSTEIFKKALFCLIIDTEKYSRDK